MFYNYDRKSAVRYAKRWALEKNEEFKNYEEWGGNCTNYISQCVNAGGVPMDFYGENLMKHWYWKSDSKRAPSWTASEPFFQYFMGNNNKDSENFGVYAIETSYENLEIGDVVQLVEDNSAYHTMIVTKVVYEDDKLKDYLISQNTYDLLNYPLSLKVGQKRYIKILGYYM